MNRRESTENCSGCLEFDCREDALAFLFLFSRLYDKYLKNEEAVANALGYPSISALRKDIEAVMSLTLEVPEDE